MAGEMDPDQKGPGEFVRFAMKRIPDDDWPLSIVAGAIFVVVGAVFGVMWFLGTVLKTIFASAAHKEE
jgi:hypothetical protein